MIEREWEPEQRDLGGLGLASICRETRRVLLRLRLRAIPKPNLVNIGPPLLSALLLADVAGCCALSSRVDRGVDEGTSLLRFLLYSAALSLLHTVCVLLFLLCTAAYTLCCVAFLNRTGGCNLLATDSVHLPAVDLLTRLLCTFILVAVPYVLVFPSLFIANLLLLLDDDVMLPLWLLGWASAAYAAPVCQLACVVSVLENTSLLGAVRRSQELLAGKSWRAAACVVVTLQGCIIIALLKAFQALVVDDALGLGLVFQVTAGAAMFVALRAVLVVTLVAQPVTYTVCKRRHHQDRDVLHRAHLD